MKSEGVKPMRKVLMVAGVLILCLILAACGGVADNVVDNGEAGETPDVAGGPNPTPTAAPTDTSTSTPGDSSSDSDAYAQRHFFVTTANLNMRSGPSAETQTRGVVATGTWVEVLEFYSDEWFRVFAFGAPSIHNENNLIWEGYMAAEFLERVEINLWPLPTPSISDFGVQVTTAFLRDFDSLFTPIGWRNEDTGEVRGIHAHDGRLLNNEPHFALVSGMEDGVWSDRVFDHLGNEIGNDVPFMVDGMIATAFRLFDLDNSGVPIVMITFSGTSWWHSQLFRFVDGRFMQMTLSQNVPSGMYHFIFDQNGRLGVIATAEGGEQSAFYHVTFSADVLNMAHVFMPNMTFAWELQGLTPIPSLLALENEISEEIMR